MNLLIALVLEYQDSLQGGGGGGGVNDYFWRLLGTKNHGDSG